MHTSERFPLLMHIHRLLSDSLDSGCARNTLTLSIAAFTLIGSDLDCETGYKSSSFCVEPILCQVFLPHILASHVACTINQSALAVHRYAIKTGSLVHMIFDRPRETLSFSVDDK